MSILIERPDEYGFCEICGKLEITALNDNAVDDLCDDISEIVRRDADNPCGLYHDLRHDVVDGEFHRYIFLDGMLGEDAVEDLKFLLEDYGLFCAN